MNEFENCRLENVLQVYATTEWRKPMPVVGLLYHEVVRLRKALVQTAAEAESLYDQLQWSKAKSMTQEIMAKEIEASLHYELNKSSWQKLKDLIYSVIARW